MERRHIQHKNQSSLLYRVILSASQAGDIILDPFFGSGTTGAVAKKLHRHWIGIERDPAYVELASQRLDSIQNEPFDSAIFKTRVKAPHKRQLRFGSLLENGLLIAGQELFFKGDPDQNARVMPDGHLLGEGFSGSIHQTARQLSGGNPCNGWEHWHYRTKSGEIRPINDLRQQLAGRILQDEEDQPIHPDQRDPSIP